MDASSKSQSEGGISMSKPTIEQQILAARPSRSMQNVAFTDAVMQKLQNREIISSQFRRTNVKQKETFIMKLRTLPVFALIAIVLGAGMLLTGTVYAVVETIKSNIKVNESGTNQFGRNQLNVTMKNCDNVNKESVTYELKRGGNLSTDDGAKTLQARCEIDTINAWFTKNNPVDFPTRFQLEGVDTVLAVDDSTITFKKTGKKEIAANSKFLSGFDEIAKKDIKAGVKVFIYPSAISNSAEDLTKQPLRVFLLTQDAKYYGSDLQSYVNERGTCPGNPSRDCLKQSNINHTTLVISEGAGYGNGGVALDFKEVQGKVVAFDSTSITLDVGKGVTYTIKAPSNIIDQYNRTDVYKLGGIDTIYANTDPEDLKVKKGDSLGITYIGTPEESLNTIEWSRVLVIELMVERIPDNLGVLRKY